MSVAWVVRSLADPNIADQLQMEHLEILARIGWGIEKAAIGVQKL